jgi:hypothetical protein
MMGSARWGFGGLFLLAFMSIARAQNLPPEDVTILKSFEGQWSFASSDPAQAGALAFGNGIGACGAEKDLRLNFREEVESDGTRFWVLRRRKDAPLGSTVIKIEQDGASYRVMASFMGIREIWEKQGDRLKVSGFPSGTSFVFKRCR